MTKHRLITFSILLFISLFSQHSLAAQQPAPNILLIIADDMGIDVTNGYLDVGPQPTTPHIDQLRDAGVMFTNTWATPVCTPTRASLLCGKYGEKTGVQNVPGNLDLEHTSLFNILRQQSPYDYSGAVIGKWHVSNPADYSHPSQHGVDHYEGIFRGAVGDYYNWTKVVDEQETQVDEYVTTHLTDAAIDWIGEQQSPWCLWLAHVAPHSPWHVPPAGTYTIEDTSTNQGKYLAAIEAMDHEIGRLMASMDDATLANTVVIFVGDNGTPRQVTNGYDRMKTKGSLYEGGIRVPMYISGSGVDRVGEVESQLTQSTDLHATILELAGIQLAGGVHNSLSLKPLLSCDIDMGREYIYADMTNDDLGEGYAIRNSQYKLISYEAADDEFYDVAADIYEQNNLISNLTAEQANTLELLKAEAMTIRGDWSCSDGIQNGDEIGIDDCESNCSEVDELSSDKIDCCEIPAQPSVYYEYIESDRRQIYTNNFPSHMYCYNSINQQPVQTHHDFGIDRQPIVTADITKVVRNNGRPARYFGVAKNGVIFAPAPAQPFIFENQNTGQFNWDWVYEPTNNSGSGPNRVGLDCAAAHTGGQGYHYHGNMIEYVNTEMPGIAATNDVPEQILHIGWAADGHPILYRFAPDTEGNVRERLPSYQLKQGLRPGNGISAPCGPYTGKYTADYEYICGKGDLDECNGMPTSVTVATAEGAQTFGYCYVITSTFPQIPRCMVGRVSEDFDNGNDPLTGIDEDNDGFLSSYDCDDMDASINPLAIEIEGNDVDENCDGLLTASHDMTIPGLSVSPNPSHGTFTVKVDGYHHMETSLMTTNGRIVKQQHGTTTIDYTDVPAGSYILTVTLADGATSSQIIVVL